MTNSTNINVNPVVNLVINKMKRIPYIGKYIFGFKIIKADKSNLVKGSENE